MHPWGQIPAGTAEIQVTHKIKDRPHFLSAPHFNPSFQFKCSEFLHSQWSRAEAFGPLLFSWQADFSMTAAASFLVIFSQETLVTLQSSLKCRGKNAEKERKKKISVHIYTTTNFVVLISCNLVKLHGIWFISTHVYVICKSSLNTDSLISILWFHCFQWPCERIIFCFFDQICPSCQFTFIITSDLYLTLMLTLLTSEMTWLHRVFFGHLHHQKKNNNKKKHICQMIVVLKPKNRRCSS